MRTLFLTILAASALLLGGCASTAGGDITGQTWHLTSITTVQRQEIVPAEAVANYTITFNDDGTWDGQADCNQVSGTYTIEGRRSSRSRWGHRPGRLRGGLPQRPIRGGAGHHDDLFDRREPDDPHPRGQRRAHVPERGPDRGGLRSSVRANARWTWLDGLPLCVRRLGHQDHSDTPRSSGLGPASARERRPSRLARQAEPVHGFATPRRCRHLLADLGTRSPKCRQVVLTTPVPA